MSVTGRTSQDDDGDGACAAFGRTVSELQREITCMQTDGANRAGDVHCNGRRSGTQTNDQVFAYLDGSIAQTATSVAGSCGACRGPKYGPGCTPWNTMTSRVSAESRSC